MVKKVTLKSIKKLLPQKKTFSNKTHGGRTLVIAGSPGFYGAAVLAAQAALRVGSGYVILLSDLKKWNIVKNPDFLAIDYKKERIKNLKFNSVAIGPGLGVTKNTEQLIQDLIKLKITNVVVDADALTVIAKKKLTLPSGWIITPHEGEMARLLHTTSQKVKSARLKHLKMAMEKYGCAVLLKGHKTLIGDKNKVYEIQTGNQALAKSGTGDVLTGMIAGFMAQNLNGLQATLLAATIHGALADQWIKDGKDVLSLMASDLIQQLPIYIKKIR